MVLLDQALRNPTPFDVSELATLFTDPDLRHYLGGACDLQQARASAEELTRKGRAFPAWVVMQPGSREACGFVSLDLHHDGKDVEVSYALTQSAQRQGLGRRAVALALSKAWHMGIDIVVAETQSANLRSIMLLDSLGFTIQRRLVRFGAEQVLFAVRSSGTNAV
jgi:[ribosomal protein S5]-alanine N-acetyltransferase